MRFLAKLAVLLLALCAPAHAEDIPDAQAEAILQKLLQSHIDANVPAESDFERFLLRDLLAFFSGRGTKSPSVTYEFLREGPTQTGISYPKFYLWVRVKGSSVIEGAARIQAINRERFEVLQFFEKAEVTKIPGGPASIFPPDVAQAINRRVNDHGVRLRAPHNQPMQTDDSWSRPSHAAPTSTLRASPSA